MGVKRNYFCFLILTVFLFSASQVFALSADEILEKVDAVMSAPKDSTGTGIMILIDKKGKQKERRLKMWSRYHDEKDDWSLTKFISPPEVRNLGFLSLADDQMYLYLPAFDRIRRIASHARKESFAGSDLSNDDLSTGKYSDHYESKLLEENDTEYKLELIRKPGSNRIYPKILVWINKQHFYALKMELFDENKNLWKTMGIESKQIQGYWTFTKITMTDVKKNHKTVMKMEDMKFDNNLEDSIFTKRYLKRRIKGE